MDGSAQEKLRILILDDYPVVRRGIRQILAQRFDPSQFGEGEAGPEGLDRALSQPWDLVIVAIDLPDRESTDVLSELKRMRPGQPVLAFIGRAELEDAVVVVKAGTAGNVALEVGADRPVPHVRRISTSGTAGQSTLGREARPDWGRRRGGKDLSNREREVLRLIGWGRTVKEIAADLTLSDKTISTYRTRILTKLGLRTTAELIRYAVINRLAD